MAALTCRNVTAFKYWSVMHYLLGYLVLVDMIAIYRMVEGRMKKRKTLSSIYGTRTTHFDEYVCL